MSHEIGAETVLQPSLHTLQEYAHLVLDEVESRGIVADDLRSELEKGCEFVYEIIDEALTRLSDAGYAWVESDDSFLIFPQGAELPSEWED